MYEVEMISGEIGRAVHFLQQAATGKGFYGEISKVLLQAIEAHAEPEEVLEKIMAVDGREEEKKAIFFRFLYSYNRYDVSYPSYDSKRCNDA